MRRRINDWRSAGRRRLDCAPVHLDLAQTLDCGQVFRWRRAGETWVGVVGERVFRLEPGWFSVWPDDDGAEEALRTYLRLDVDLTAVQAELRERDARVGEAIDRFPGLRVLRQPAQEALLTFLCSAANNVTRITRSVDLLARIYGEPIGDIGDEQFFTFPSPGRLAGTAPGELRQRAGLGFRGERLRQVAEQLGALQPDWPTPLASESLEDARVELARLPGVGPKIADCVCLFGLGFDEAVPVDTHVAALARELFSPHLNGYQAVQDAYRARYGRWAGWAQQYLFHGRRIARDLPTPSEIRLIYA